MSIVLARKLAALKMIWFPEVDFQIYPVALTPDQVLEYGLPESPLKPGDKRGPAWEAATGVKQTEIDTIATLQPDLLADIAINAIELFYDTTLDERVNTAKQDWERDAAAAIEEQTSEGQRKR